MKVLKFLGGLVTAIFSILLSIVRAIAQELFQLARGLLVFVPMLGLGLMVFMFFQTSLTMEQADVMGQILLAFICGWATGMIVRGKADAFWKKD